MTASFRLLNLAPFPHDASPKKEEKSTTHRAFMTPTHLIFLPPSCAPHHLSRYSMSMLKAGTKRVED